MRTRSDPAVWPQSPIGEFANYRLRISVEQTKFEPAAFVFAKDAVKPSDKGNGG